MGGSLGQHCPECPRQRWGTMCHKCPDNPEAKGCIIIENEEFYFEQVYPADYAWWYDVEDGPVAILEES